MFPICEIVRCLIDYEHQIQSIKMIIDYVMNTKNEIYILNECHVVEYAADVSSCWLKVTKCRFDKMLVLDAKSAKSIKSNFDNKISKINFYAISAKSIFNAKSAKSEK